MYAGIEPVNVAPVNTAAKIATVPVTSFVNPADMATTAGIQAMVNSGFTSTVQTNASTQTQQLQTVAEESKKIIETKQKIEELENKKEESSIDSPRTRAANTGSDLGLHLGSDFGGSDAALIVFAVVGLVIVFAWIPYFPILFYDYLSHPDDYETRQMVGLNYTAAPHNRSSYKGKNQYRKGFFAGSRYSLFFKQKDESDDDFQLGLTTEIGLYQLENDSNNNIKNFYGEYWLLGPSMMFGLPEFWLQLDLMGGSTFDSNLGLMTKADISLNGEVGRDFFVGLGFGALYYDVKGGKGLTTGDKDVGLTWLVKAGHCF